MSESALPRRRRRPRLTGCTEPCRECGKQIGASHYGNGIGDRIKKYRVCFNCDFWFGHLASMYIQAKHDWRRVDGLKHPEGNFLVVVSGHLYSVNFGTGRDNPPVAWGFGGREGRLTLLSEKIVIASRNVWYCGKIPENFRDRMPDTAEWCEGYDLTPVKMGG